MYVAQIMSIRVDTVSADEKLSHASLRLHENDTRFLPVVDDNRQLQGLITRQEIAETEPSAITTLSVGEANYLLSKLKVSDAMITEVITCTPKTLIEEAGRVMRVNRISCLPVVEDGILVGLITDDDILDFLLDVTGVTQTETTRIALLLPDETGHLGQLLDDVNDLGGYIATVVSPISHDYSGRRVVIVRFKADQPETLDQALRDMGYELIDEVVAEEKTHPVEFDIDHPTSKMIAEWMRQNDRFINLLGAQLVEAEAGYCKVRLEISNDMLNAVDLTQGGVAFTLADFAFAVASNSHGRTAVSLSASISYTAATTTGDVLVATAHEDNCSNKTSHYTVRVEKTDGTLVALFHGTAFRRTDTLIEWMQRKKFK